MHLYIEALKNKSIAFYNDLVVFYYIYIYSGYRKDRGTNSVLLLVNVVVVHEAEEPNAVQMQAIGRFFLGTTWNWI